MIFARGTMITRSDLPGELARTPGHASAAEPPRTRDELAKAKESAAQELERAFLCDALARAHGRVSKAANLTGMNRSRFHQLMKKHGLKASGYKK